MASTFTSFSKFPTEIRFMVWDLALPSRTVILDHNITQETPAVRQFIKESHPSLLSVNQESRQYALRKYTSVFSAPRIEWSYSGSLKSVDLRKVLKALGLPQKGTISSMLQTVTKYMNTHPEEAQKFTTFASHQDVSKDIQRPQWFDPKADMLIFRFPLDTAHRVRAGKTLLWGPWKKNESLKIGHIAFMVDAFDARCRRYDDQRIWTRNGLKLGRQASTTQVSKLKTLSILVSDACEIITLEMDRKGLLAKGEWAFGLDTTEDQFKDEMGPRWAGVTWKVTLAKDGDLNLSQLVKAWNPDTALWEQDKRELCDANQAVRMMWHIAERIQAYRPVPGRAAKLLNGGDGNTYLGPSALPKSKK